MNRTKRIAKKLLLTGLGLLLGLLLAETTLRVLTAVAERRVPTKRFADKPAAPGAIRMALLGGSTSNGWPYSGALDDPGRTFNLLSVTRFLLEQRYGCPAVEIDNYAGPNWSAQTTVDHYFERPGPRPDVLVLYTGQNETTQYYSPNMVPPPAWLAPLARLQSGNLLLRRLFTRQVAPADQRYSGTFFSDNIIPAYERAHNLARYRHAVERMIRHAAAEEIFLVVVIPQSNYLFPPTRSVYAGPAGRKAEALRLFKQAWEARHLEDQPDRALALLAQLQEFCGFAELFYELGDIHYARGDFEAALPLLRRARDTDGFPICITPTYREALRELLVEHGVPHIDLDEVIREKLGRPVPDYTSFLDDCHLHLDVYLELSREIIRVLRENGFGKLPLPPQDLDVTPREWTESLGITPLVMQRALAWTAKYHIEQADYAFCKQYGLKRGGMYLGMLGDADPSTLPFDPARMMPELDRAIRSDAVRMRKWVRHEGPMPVGTAFVSAAPPEGFGGDAEVASSQGDALMAHGEWALAVGHYRAALARDPGNVSAQGNLGVALRNLMQLEQAVDAFERALELDPSFLPARRNLGKTLLALERHQEAVAHLREVARAAPNHAGVLREYGAALYAWAWRLATAPDPAVRDGARAVELAEEVCRITGYAAFDALDALAAAHAESGRFEEAVATANRALDLARRHGDPRAEAIARRLTEYREGRPWREEGAGR